MTTGFECVRRSNMSMFCYFCIATVVSWFYISRMNVYVVKFNSVNFKTDSHYDNMNEFFLEEALLQAERKIDTLTLATWSTQNTLKAFLTKKLRDADDKIGKLEKTLRRFNLIPDEKEVTVPPKSQLGRDLDYDLAHRAMENHVTIGVFSFDETWDCLLSRISVIRKEYPNIRIMTLSSSSLESYNTTDQKMIFVPNIGKEGKALEHMTSKLTTKYFLFLSSGAEISPHTTDHGVSWLFHALENISELDFVGGAFLRYQTGVKYPTMEIPCHRLRLCNYALSQSFEYRYSVGDMMICEETSSSFMGRTNSLIKVGNFDPTLNTMAILDFFLRAKGKAIVGLRPEVWFPLYRICKPAVWTATREAELNLPFMKKYELYVIRDSFGKEVLAKYDSVNYHINQIRNGTYTSPLRIRGIRLNLDVAANFLESKNISYFLDAGSLLGAIKTEGILPWDRDADLIYYGNATEVETELPRYCQNIGLRAPIITDAFGNLTKIVLLIGEVGYIDMIDNPGVPNPEDLQYIHVLGRSYQVKKSLFSMVRRDYGLNYLKMRFWKDGRNMQCIKVGYHACVPPEFADGGGHWRDYYCHL